VRNVDWLRLIRLVSNAGVKAIDKGKFGVGLFDKPRRDSL
jgi:hypothetical protein